MIVPGTLFFAAGVMVLRSAGATPDWLGLWLPGSCLTGIGIGLAFPTLGSAAVRDVPDDRFATASAVNAAFRQVGAVLGTAILVAIVGEPATPASRPRRLQRRLPLLGLRRARCRSRRARPAASVPEKADETDDRSRTPPPGTRSRPMPEAYVFCGRGVVSVWPDPVKCRLSFLVVGAPTMFGADAVTFKVRNCFDGQRFQALIRSFLEKRRVNFASVPDSDDLGSAAQFGGFAFAQLDPSFDRHGWLGHRS